MTKMMKKKVLTRLQDELLQELRYDVFSIWNRLLSLVDEKSTIYKTVFLNASKLNRVQRMEQEGLVTKEEFDVDVNKSTSTALTIINQLSEQDLIDNWSLKVAREDAILVYCFDEIDRETLEEVYDEYVFKGVHYAYADELQRIPSPKEDGTDWRVVVFSMAHIKDDIRNERELRDLDMVSRYNQERFKLLERIIEETDYYIVYHGNEFYRLKEWRNRVHAANSPFSLLARTEEMLDFLKKTGR